MPTFFFYYYLLKSWVQIALLPNNKYLNKKDFFLGEN